MGRVGFRVFTEEERDYAVEQYKKFAELPGINIAGVITHFSTADEEQREYTKLQIKNYKAFIDKLNAAGFNPKKICANSASIMVYPEIHYDACRPGIILYGLAPSGYLKGKVLDLKPVMTVKAEIVNLKTVPAGTSVSYGRKFTSTDKETKIATIGLGYADGYSRLLSSKGEILVHGKRCRIVGRVCMDQLMIDVSEVSAKAGDIVTLIGKDGDDEITADELAAICSTIGYEVVCGISKRVPRIFHESEEE
jgi:alanine racemase